MSISTSSLLLPCLFPTFCLALKTNAVLCFRRVRKSTEKTHPQQSWSLDARDSQQNTRPVTRRCNLDREFLSHTLLIMVSVLRYAPINSNLMCYLPSYLWDMCCCDADHLIFEICAVVMQTRQKNILAYAWQMICVGSSKHLQICVHHYSRLCIH